jgi:hypothetical protein
VTSISIRGLSSHPGDVSQLYMVTTLRRFWNINGHLAVYHQELSKIKHEIGIDRVVRSEMFIFWNGIMKFEMKLL